MSAESGVWVSLMAEHPSSWNRESGRAGAAVQLFAVEGRGGSVAAGLRNIPCQAQGFPARAGQADEGIDLLLGALEVALGHLQLGQGVVEIGRARVDALGTLQAPAGGGDVAELALALAQVGEQLCPLGVLGVARGLLELLAGLADTALVIEEGRVVEIGRASCRERA